LIVFEYVDAYLVLFDEPLKETTTLMFTLPFFITASIIGVGITVIDLVMNLSDSDIDGDTDLGDESSAAADFEIASDAEVDVGAGDSGDGSVVAHDRKSRSLGPRLLGSLRHLIYFLTGFGPSGIAAITFGLTGTALVLWPVGLGLASSLLGAALLSFLKKEMTSQFTRADLIMAEAEVLVSIHPGQLGQVRASVGGAYSDRYAYLSDPGQMAKRGETVRIVSVEENHVIVEKETI
jgi:membrane protein implicated in regulation of membrane protease activity